MTTLARFIEQAWNDHVADPGGVAAHVGDGIAMLDADPERLGDFLQLAEHLHLAHFGDTAAMQAVLDRAGPFLAVQPQVQPLADRARLAMSLLQDQATVATLPAPATIRGHGTAICGWVSRGDIDKARQLLQAAAAIARDADLATRTDATKALAASCNNVATQLLDLPRRPQADTLMLDAAAWSRSAWAEVGTWMNVERAEYLLALCASATGDGARAVEHAASCLSICEANGADAFELFFAHEAMAKALMASGDRSAAGEQAKRMAALLPEIEDEGNRAYAAAALKKL